VPRASALLAIHCTKGIAKTSTGTARAISKSICCRHYAAFRCVFAHRRDAPKAQRNFTDPESRILKSKDGYIQGYNAEAVDAQAQIIVAVQQWHRHRSANDIM
jgi:hypothetical protein